MAVALVQCPVQVLIDVLLGLGRWLGKYGPKAHIHVAISQTLLGDGRIDTIGDKVDIRNLSAWKGKSFSEGGDASLGSWVVMIRS